MGTSSIKNGIYLQFAELLVAKKDKSSIYSLFTLAFKKQNKSIFQNFFKVRYFFKNISFKTAPKYAISYYLGMRQIVFKGPHYTYINLSIHLRTIRSFWEIP
jgi:hypothetical protein